MKKLLLFLVSIMGCEHRTEFVKFSPGDIHGLLESGSFGSTKTIQTIFISFIKEDDIEFKHGFVIIKLPRTYKNENKAYQLLDHYENIDRYERIDTSALNDEEKTLKIWYSNNALDIRQNFREHVKVNIEKEALESGISEKVFLTFE